MQKVVYRPSLWVSLKPFMAGLILILGVRWLAYEPFVIPSGSMLPTLLIHDHILVKKWSFGIRWPFMNSWALRWKRPQRGQIVVFKGVENPSIYLIKRIVAVAGDKILINQEGLVFVNDQKLPLLPLADSRASSIIRNYFPVDGNDFENVGQYSFFEETTGDRLHRVALKTDPQKFRVEFSTTVPEGYVFAMGDNRDNSNDSRFWGPVPIVQVLGEAQLIWLSCNKTLEAMPTVCDPNTIRWPRLLSTLE